MSAIQTVGIVGYDKCSEQDTITALEVLRGAAMVLANQIAPWKRKEPPSKLDVKLVTLVPGNVTMQMGTQVVADAVIKDSDLFDLLYIPGGVGSGPASLDAKMLGLIQRHHKAGKIIASNCSGVGILARAGILGKNPVTCVAAVAPGLREEGINVPQPRRMWIGLPDQRLWTTTGSYGVNGSTVALVAHYFGEEVGTIVAMMFDTLGGIGQSIYELKGPEFYYHPDLEAKFAAYFQPMLLPAPGGKK
jgi:transcriptional regulator GlxA family with amidase domain